MYKTKLNKIWNLIDSIKNDITLPIISDFLEWFYEKINLHFNKNNPNIEISKWDIFFVELGKNIWSELSKQRPCLVISKNIYNKTNTVIIIPLKSYKWKIYSYTQVLIKHKNLKSKSVVDCLSIRQIDKKRINNYIWKIKKQDLLRIEKKLAKIFWIKNRE